MSFPYWSSGRFAMIYLLRIKKSLIPSCGFTNFAGRRPRFYGTRTMVSSCGNDLVTYGQISEAARRKARRKGQAALLDYLHSTRSLQFLDADNISKNSPQFLEKILGRIDYSEEDIGRSITRFLRYHPVNEFEPFFESLGLKPDDYACFLPEHMMFLTDDSLLLGNYHVLCEYGIPRDKIGRIFIQVPEIFRYHHGVLASKFKACEDAGISRSVIAKVIVCSPHVLVGNVHVDFVSVLDILRKGGLALSSVEELLPENIHRTWSQLLSLVNLLLKNGYNEEQLCSLIRQHPDILFEGQKTFSVIGLLTKFGTPLHQACAVISEGRGIEVGKFWSNLMRCFVFFNEIDMEPFEIGKIIRSQPLLLGSCALKKSSTLLSRLKSGKMRLCEAIQKDPLQLKNWVIGLKSEPLGPSDKKRSKLLKKQFLLDIGFTDNTEELEKALNLIRGKGSELQERFDCMVRDGLNEEDVCAMIKACPLILNQSKELIDMKISLVVNDLGYPISSLVVYPKFLVRAAEFIKLRLFMYNWLRDQGAVDRILAFSTVLNSSERLFVKQYVNIHPRGPEVWQELKTKIYGG
ncbi:Transcription termination factor MTEF18, mitochondrial [Linum grandiflorum]